MNLRRVEVKVFRPGNKTFVRQSIRAGANRRFTDGGVDAVLDYVAEEIEKIFAGHDYTVVQVGRGAYNFVHRGDCRLCEKETAA